MRVKPSQLNQQKQELNALENELRQKKLIQKQFAQTMLNRANKTWSQNIFESTMNRLRLLLENENTNAMRTFDAFRPYGPEQLLNQGNMHLMDQIDGVPYNICPDALLTGVLLIGPQGSGKSYLIRKLCTEFSRVKPNTKILIVDPKNGFQNLPNFRHLDLEKTSFSFKSPSNADQKNFIYEFMPILAGICSLIYGLDFLNQAVDIAFAQLQCYMNQLGKETKDTYQSLLYVPLNNALKNAAA